MLSFKMYCCALTGAVALLLSTVTAHGYLGLPAVTFPSDVDKTQFVATIESSASGFSGSFSGTPAENAAAFWAAFNSSKYSSVKEFVTDLGQIVASGANIECGLTDPDETPQPLPDELEWTHSDTEGFTSSHEATTKPSVATTPSTSNSVSDEEDCDSLDVAGSDEEDEDCGSLDVAGSDEDCDSLDFAGSETDEHTTLSESSLNFGDVDGGYTSGKVQAPEQN
ncbi:hypothetical protein PR002_g18076 [Phytophthora rubi]|uniref:RxLR effector protein n=1 Tax=Phytophthora rubi TaxID=129364 RepID=A0A6A3K155_9STRA|nr:hypothetical protein PR002_g18076 [Phytophthora rubi]